MSAAHYSEGDTLETPTGTVTIESINRFVSLSDGRTMRRQDITQGLASGQLDLIPEGTGDRDVYVRFGDLPDGEQSTDHSSGRKEAGVSVYACEEDDGVYYLGGTELQTVFYLLDRPIYLVSGERVGTGADGEPLIRDCEIEADLTTPKGCGGFVERDD